jgi:hypothetical protein
MDKIERLESILNSPDLEVQEAIHILQDLASNNIEIEFDFEPNGYVKKPYDVIKQEL